MSESYKHEAMEFKQNVVIVGKVDEEFQSKRGFCYLFNWFLSVFVIKFVSLDMENK